MSRNDTPAGITSIAIAGTGALGRCLARSLREADLPLDAILSRDPGSVVLPPELAGIPVFTLPVGMRGQTDPTSQSGNVTKAQAQGSTAEPEPEPEPETEPEPEPKPEHHSTSVKQIGFRPQKGLLLFLAIPDDAIRPLAENLAVTGTWDGVVVAHCSGAMPSGLLDPLRKAGASAAAFHPVQTFAPGSGPEAFRGIFTSLEGDEAATGILDGLARRLGAKPVTVNEEGKLRLHLAAVFASNYLIGLMEAAQDILGEIDWGGREMPGAGELLGPIHLRTARNIVEMGHHSALTGPILRGDIETVRRHLVALSGHDGLDILYARLGLFTLKVARARQPVAAHDEMEKLLKSVAG